MYFILLLTAWPGMRTHFEVYLRRIAHLYRTAVAVQTDIKYRLINRLSKCVAVAEIRAQVIYFTKGI